jgi:hypothetical protein
MRGLIQKTSQDSISATQPFLSEETFAYVSLNIPTLACLVALGSSMKRPIGIGGRSAAGLDEASGPDAQPEGPERSARRAAPVPPNTPPAGREAARSDAPLRAGLDAMAQGASPQNRPCYDLRKLAAASASNAPHAAQAT